jgi:F-type H+-transporting ATPase subunit gamma
MAQNLQQLRKRIKTSNSISQMARAMEVVSASKIHRVQTTVERHGPYSRKIRDMVKRIITDQSLHSKEMQRFLKRSDGKRLVYIISPDKGLAGGLIINLLKTVNSYLRLDDYIVVVGKKASENVIRYGYNVITSFNMGTKFLNYDEIFPMIDIAKKFYIYGEVTKVSIIYTEFKSMLVQEPVAEEIFPINPIQEFKETAIDYLFEPSPLQVLKDLLPFYFEVEFYSAIMNAYASEQAARMVAMRNAKNNANDICAALTKIYNKSRQEKITNELLDLANGQQEI